MILRLHRKLALSAAVPAAFFFSFLVPAHSQPTNPSNPPRPDIEGSIKAVMAMMAIEQKMISDGTAPPVLLKYDDQLLALLNEGADIWAKQDKARAREFGARLNAILAAKDAAQKPYEAVVAAGVAEMARRAADAKSGADFDRCTDMAGRNTCRSTPGCGSTGPHPCPSGPGPGEVLIGDDGGGEPYCQ